MMTTVADAADAKVALSARARGSWIDRLTGAVSALPGPASLIYLLGAATAIAIMSVALWIMGALPVGTFTRGVLVGAGAGAWFLWLVGRVNVSARGAVEALRND